LLLPDEVINEFKLLNFYRGDRC